MNRATSLLTAIAPLALCACALTPPPAKVDAAAPQQWQAPLPHNGQLSELRTWWASQGDPLLPQLIEAAQLASPSIAAAKARLAQSQATRVAAGAAMLPSLGASLSSTRTSQQSETPSATINQLQLQSSWEIDVFGARRAERDAAQARQAGAEALWHDARVSVAAEVANQYYGLRACEQLLAVARQDASSRADTARLTKLSADAGFQAPAIAAAADASAADARSRATSQGAQCEIDRKALVALTALPEPQLRQRLAASAAVAATPIAISSLPAQILAQRPDVFNAEREVAAASADVGSALADRYPRLTLQGAIGRGNVRSGGESITANTWNLGPVALNVPLFDAGRRRAATDAARARYDAAVLSYQATARQAVREVEEALVRLDSTSARSGDARLALDGYRSAYRAAEDRYKNGLASLLELEDARRTRLAAENAVVALENERNGAWVSLYRAAGGGWTSAASLAQQ